MKYFCWEKNSFGEWTPVVYTEDPKDREMRKDLYIQRTQIRRVPENLSEMIELYGKDKPHGPVRMTVTDTTGEGEV